MNSFRRLSGSGLLRAFVERRSTPRYAKAAPVPAVQCVFERLEPRILLSADVLGGIAANDLLQGDQHAELTAFDANQNLEQLIAPFLVSTDKQSADSGSVPTAIDLADFASFLNAAANDSASDSDVDAFADSLKSLLPELGGNDALRQEIIFVDAATPNYEQLIDGIATDAAGTQYLVFVLDSERDGVAQIGEVLGNYTGIDAVHLVSHGGDGEVQIGNGVLNNANLNQYQTAIQSWANALDGGADFLIYGCNLAASDVGQGLLQSLANLTGADMAASDDLTGSAALGGDWDLEYSYGEIEAQVAFGQAVQQQWQGTLATFTVNTFDDTIDADLLDANAEDAAGNTSLRAAVMQSNQLGGNHTIILGAGTYTLTEGAAGENDAVGGDLDIKTSLDIVGSGAASTIIDGGGIDRVFQVSGPFSVSSLSDLTVQGGVVSGAGLDGAGGGILLDGVNTQLTLNRVNVIGNQATEGAGIYNRGELALTDVAIDSNNTNGGTNAGGGLYNWNIATLENVTISGNTAAIGGGIYNDSTADLTNVTLSGNTATVSEGGGLYNTSTSTATLTNVTVSNNTAQTQGGGIFNNSTVNISNTIVANNTSVGGTGHDVFGAFSSDGSNIIEDTGASIASFSGDAIGDPNLDALRDNGGFGQTHALLASSIAIDNGSNATAPATDQRGVVRGDGLADIGAYENNTNILVVDTTSGDIDAPDASTIDNLLANVGGDGKISLSEAIRATNGTANLAGGADQIRFQIDGALVGGEHLIAPSLAFDPIIQSLSIDATTDDNYTGTPIIRLDGNAAGAVDGLVLAAGSDGSTIRGLSITQFDGPSGAIAIYSNDNLVAGNYLGVQTDGSTPDGNTRGINIIGGADNTIGGIGDADRNVISGSTWSGIRITDAGATGNVVLGNYIGTDANAAAPIGNLNGVFIDNGASDNTIGGITPGSGNVISGNADEGVEIQDAASTGNTISGNYIGTTADGLSGLGNTGAGVLMDFAEGNTVGGTADGAGNLISGNFGFGVRVYGGSAVNNAILENEIYGNTLNDIEHSLGGNYGREDPTLDTVVTSGAGSVSITGTLNDATLGADASIIIDFFSNPGNDREGRTYLGSDTFFTDGSGIGTINSTLTATVAAGEWITATITDTAGNTSEFSASTQATATTVASGVATTAAATDSTLEDTDLVFSLANSNAIVVDDGTAGDAVLRTTLSATNGTLTLATTAGLSSVSGDGTDTIIVIGAESTINTALDGLTYTPASDYNGPADLKVSTDLQADLLGYYAFNQAVAPGADSSPAGGNDGAASGSATGLGAHAEFDADRDSDVLVLDGVDDNIQIAGRFGTPSNVTIAAWVNVSAANDQEVISIGGSIVLRLNDVNNGDGVTGFYHDGSGWNHTDSALFIGGDGWRHVAFTFDDTNNTQVIYVDGVALGTTSYTGSINWAHQPDTTIGSHANGSDYWLDGRVDEARIYDRALSAGEIQAMANDRHTDMALVAITVDPDNDLPTADAGGPYTINEGGNLTLNASASDPDPDTLSYNWDIDGDGDYDDASGLNPTVSWLALGMMDNPINDDGAYTIALQVDDGAGGITTDTVSLTVNNVAPTLSTTGTGAADAGIAYTLNLSAIDPGNDTISSWTINWGDGAIETFVGNPGSVSHIFDNAGFTYNILASAVDEDGTYMQNQLLVANAQNDSVLRFSPDAVFLQEFANTNGNDYPVDIIVGPDGKLYLSGWASNDVQRYDAATGAYIDTFVPADTAGLDSAAGLAFGPDGNLYVASRGSGEVLRFDAANGNFIDAFVASGSGGISEPEGLAFGPDGNLYVSDYSSGAVYKYDGSSGAFITEFVSSGTGGMWAAEDLVFGPDGNLYVADDANSSVLRFDGSDGTFMGAFVASGSNGLSSATGLAFGPDGNLYVGNWGEGNVLRFDGITGAFIDEYIAAGTAGLDKTDYLNFVPEHQVTVDGNKEPTGTVVISGSPVEDSVLSASQTIADGDGMGAISYQWQRDGVAISGATGNSYLLDDADVGSVISVKAAYTDGKGNAEKVISSDTAVIAGINDAPTLSAPGTVFINEIHYDNIGPDLGEFIEIAGVAGTNLNGWSLVLYNGATNSVYHTEMLSGIIPNETFGFGAITWAPGGSDAIQNAISAPDGIALVDNRGNVVQFISYEGAFVADGGPADGMLSTNIGVAENNLTTPVLTSLQLKGAGTTFTWSPSSLESPGSLNAGQDINALANATHQSVAEDDTLVFSSANGNSIDIEDVDADQGAAEPMLVQLNVTNGTVVPGSTAGLGSISGVGTSALAMTGTVAEINAALEGLTFTPDANYHGAAAISIFVNDQGNNGAGGALQTGGVIFIDVASMPDDPTVENSIANQNATENALFNFTFAVDTFADADGEALTYSATLASGGFLPGWLNFDPASRTFSGTPLNGDIGFVDVEVTADDSQTGSTPATDVFRITVASDNNDPTLDNAISDQIGFAHDPYSFTFAADTFSDLDGDSLSYSARLANGNPLPGWLGFDAATRTFSSAEPGHVAIGSIDVEVIADDGEGGTPATAVFGITIDHRNDDPAVINPIVDQLATEDEAFSFVVPADTFEDYEGQAMTYSAELDNGDPLPTWLDFDAATRTFSGTPLVSDVGQIDIKVYADDGAGGSENDTFELTIVASNDDPFVNNPIPDQLALEDTLFNFTFAADAFSDEEGDTLTYSATLAGGGALPGWLIFDPSTRTFSGTPLNGDVGAIDVEVSADDGQAGSVAATDTFRITVANDNDDPTLDNAIADQSATEDTAFSFTFNANTFGDVDSGDTLVYSATLSSGASLPAWLNFDAATRTFSGMPAQADVGTLNVTVTADDTRGGSPATDTFAIVIANSNDAPDGSVVLSPTAPAHGQTISAAISVTDEDGMGALSYQWQRAGVDIAGATSSTYVVTNADVGAPLTLVVSYIDSFGQAEAVVSNNAAVFIPPVVEPTPPAPEPEPEPEPEVTDSGTPTESEEEGDPVPETQEPPVEPGAEDNTDDTVSVLEADNAEAAQINAAIDESTENEVDEPLDYKEKDFDIAQVSFNLVRLQSEYTPYNDPLTLVQFGGFVDAIDQMREDIIEAALDNAPVVGSTFAVSAGMSAGYVAWLARSGAVLGSVMSAMPMWRFIDPLPVLNKLDADGEDEESLEAIIDNSEKNSAAANVAAEAAVDVDVDSNSAASDKIEKPGAAPDSTH